MARSAWRPLGLLHEPARVGVLLEEAEGVADVDARAGVRVRHPGALVVRAHEPGAGLVSPAEDVVVDLAVGPLHALGERGLAARDRHLVELVGLARAVAEAPAAVEQQRVDGIALAVDAEIFARARPAGALVELPAQRVVKQRAEVVLDLRQLKLLVDRDPRPSTVVARVDEDDRERLGAEVQPPVPGGVRELLGEVVDVDLGDDLPRGVLRELEPHAADGVPGQQRRAEQEAVGEEVRQLHVGEAVRVVVPEARARDAILARERLADARLVVVLEEAAADLEQRGRERQEQRERAGGVACVHVELSRARARRERRRRSPCFVDRGACRESSRAHHADDDARAP